MKIGNLKLKNRLFLAPMVNVTDLPYRLICKGAGMKYTEMLYVDAILHENRKTENLMTTCKEDKPVGLQITGNSIGEFEKFVKSGRWKKFDLIDLNCGCPSLRITGNAAGSYLLKNPEKISEIVLILKKTEKPVTVKIRLGVKENNVLEVARAVSDAGADALTVHARLAIHGRSVRADWAWLKKVKKIVKIPVIGNGDVFSGDDARRMLEICDGVMIARGAIGDPLIFDRTSRYLSRPPAQRKEEEVNVKENLKLFLKYLELEEKYFGSGVDFSRVKYLGGKFLRGFSGAGKARVRMMVAKSLDEIKEVVKVFDNR